MSRLLCHVSDDVLGRIMSYVNATAPVERVCRRFRDAVADRLVIEMEPSMPLECERVTGILRRRLASPVVRVLIIRCVDVGNTTLDERGIVYCNPALVSGIINALRDAAVGDRLTSLCELRLEFNAGRAALFERLIHDILECGAVKMPGLETLSVLIPCFGRPPHAGRAAPADPACGTAGDRFTRALRKLPRVRRLDLLFQDTPPYLATARGATLLSAVVSAVATVANTGGLSELRHLVFGPVRSFTERYMDLTTECAAIRFLLDTVLPKLETLETVICNSWDHQRAVMAALGQATTIIPLRRLTIRGDSWYDDATPFPEVLSNLTALDLDLNTSSRDVPCADFDAMFQLGAPSTRLRSLACRELWKMPKGLCAPSVEDLTLRLSAIQPSDVSVPNIPVHLPVCRRLNLIIDNLRAPAGRSVSEFAHIVKAAAPTLEDMRLELGGAPHQRALAPSPLCDVMGTADRCRKLEICVNNGEYDQVSDLLDELCMPARIETFTLTLTGFELEPYARPYQQPNVTGIAKALRRVLKRVNTGMSVNVDLDLEYDDGSDPIGHGLLPLLSLPRIRRLRLCVQYTRGRSGCVPPGALIGACDCPLWSAPAWSRSSVESLVLSIVHDSQKRTRAADDNHWAVMLCRRVAVLPKLRWLAIHVPVDLLRGEEHLTATTLRRTVAEVRKRARLPALECLRITHR